MVQSADSDPENETARARFLPPRTNASLALMEKCQKLNTVHFELVLHGAKLKQVQIFKHVFHQSISELIQS